MKQLSSSKPISSPGRVGSEKYQAPLMMRFLRSSKGNRSRHSRSRKSPVLFFMRKKSISISETQQEPTSPKVTCIGQVRVARTRTRKKPGSERNTTRTHPNSCCCSNCWKCWLEPIRRMWVRVVCCGSVKVRTEPPKPGPRRVPEEKTRDDETNNELLVSSSTPPKNALLLTRCRSAPYRSTSLACRFLGLTDQETKSMHGVESQRESRDSRSENEEEEEEEKVNDEGISMEKSIIGGEVKEVRPPLMRCRSEPVRRGSEKLDPLSCKFWIDRRLSNTESC